MELFHEAQLFWQSYDAFARVSMAFGTMHLLFATAYYLLGSAEKLDARFPKRVTYLSSSLANLQYLKF